MELLLQNEADVNAQGGTYCTALQAASAEGYEQIVQLLIDSGADVNLRGGKYGSALQAASGAGYAGVVRLLVENSAKFDAALQITSLGRNDNIASYLLSKGANPNAQGQSFGAALQVATAAGQEKMVQLLLNAGANANGEGNHFGTALEIASATGNKGLVRLLLDKGADPGLSGGRCGLKTAELLQSTTYEVGPQINLHISPLESASAAGHDEIVLMLLDAVPRFKEKWSEPGWRLGYLVNGSLEKASSNGHLEVIRILLDSKEKFGVSGDNLCPYKTHPKMDTKMLSDYYFHGAQVSTRQGLAE